MKGYSFRSLTDLVLKIFKTKVNAGTGLSGGGSLEADRTLAVKYGTIEGTATQGNDSRLSDSREWTAATISQAEAEVGTAATRRAFTAQRVRQAITAWWSSITGVFGRDLVTSTSNTVARSKLGLGTLVVPTGAVIPFVMTTAPSGWLKANGAAVSRTTYAAVFAAVGTTYGAGDGSTTFNIPDLRGEFVRGWDDGRGVDSNRGFGTRQADEFKRHFHGLSEYGHTVQGNGYRARINYDDGPPFNGITLDANTGGQETRPRNIALLYCIKYQQEVVLSIYHYHATTGGLAGIGNEDTEILHIPQTPEWIYL